MGWAKYGEDIVSRHNGTSLAQSRLQREFGKVRPKGLEAPDPAMSLTKGKQQMSKLKDFVVTTARPLPVILLADVSGSMATNGKIEWRKSLAELKAGADGLVTMRCLVQGHLSPPHWLSPPFVSVLAAA